MSKKKATKAPEGATEAWKAFDERYGKAPWLKESFLKYRPLQEGWTLVVVADRATSPADLPAYSVPVEWKKAV